MQSELTFGSSIYFKGLYSVKHILPGRYFYILLYIHILSSYSVCLTHKLTPLRLLIMQSKALACLVLRLANQQWLHFKN